MATRPTLHGTMRTASPKAVRRAGALPAVLYGHGIENNQIQIDAVPFQKVLQRAGSTSLINLALEGGFHTVLIREVQRHPVNDTMMHVDFYQVRLDEAIAASVPLVFVGESEAVRDLGGVLVRNIDEAEVEALPQDLPHAIEVDISGLKKFDQAIRVADLRLPVGVKVLHKPDEIVALVQAPRSEEELAELTEEVKEEVEAVEGVKEEKPAEATEKEKKEAHEKLEKE